MRQEGCVRGELQGIEWWVKNLRPNEGLSFHIDKDEGLGGKGALTMPLCSAVLFLGPRNEPIVGGPLIVAGVRPTTSNFDQFQSIADEPTLVVPPRRARVALFGRAFVHGVLRSLPSTSPSARRLTLIFRFGFVFVLLLAFA